MTAMGGKRSLGLWRCAVSFELPLERGPQRNRNKGEGRKDGERHDRTQRDGPQGINYREGESEEEETNNKQDAYRVQEPHSDLTRCVHATPHQPLEALRGRRCHREVAAFLMAGMGRKRTSLAKPSAALVNSMASLT